MIRQHKVKMVGFRPVTGHVEIRQHKAKLAENEKGDQARFGSIRDLR